MNCVRPVRSLFAALLLGGGSAFGQLGATVEQAAERFGTPVEPPSIAAAESLPPNVVLRQYRLDPKTIQAWFLEGVICRILYSQPQPFSVGEVDALLSDNAENAQWIVEPTKLNPARALLGIRSWRRSDRGAAVLIPGAKESGAAASFDFSNRDWLALQLSRKSGRKPGQGNDSSPTPTPTPSPATPVPLTTSPAPVALSWTGYDGTGDPARAVWTLAGVAVGSGAEGLTALKAKLASLSPNPGVRLVPYYGDPGAGRVRVPPPELAELRAWCQARGIRLLEPQPE